MLDINKPVQTKGGRKARIICTDSKTGAYPIISLIHYESGAVDETLEYHRKNGTHCVREECDLINIPEKHVRYIALQETNLGPVFSILKTPAAPEECDSCVKVELQKGKFDE